MDDLKVTIYADQHMLVVHNVTDPEFVYQKVWNATHRMGWYITDSEFNAVNLTYTFHWTTQAYPN